MPTKSGMILGLRTGRRAVGTPATGISPPFFAARAWHGTKNGAYDAEKGNCADWTSLTATDSAMTLGLFKIDGSHWPYQQRPCTALARLVCISLAPPIQ